MDGLRLNLGCGLKRLEGFLNVDREGDPDLRHDLEVAPWPWPDDSVSEVVLCHVLEHLGREPAVYLQVFKELYRVCRDGATVRVIVPHHRHDNFFNDPTHVRAVTAEGLSLFSQRRNREWAAMGLSNSPLGLYLGIDFEVTDMRVKPSELWHHVNAHMEVTAETLMQQAAMLNNMIEEVQMDLRAVKPAGKEAA